MQKRVSTTTTRQQEDCEAMELIQREADALVKGWETAIAKNDEAMDEYYELKVGNALSLVRIEKRKKEALEKEEANVERRVLLAHDEGLMIGKGERNIWDQIEYLDRVYKIQEAQQQMVQQQYFPVNNCKEPTTTGVQRGSMDRYIGVGNRDHPQYNNNNNNTAHLNPAVPLNFTPQQTPVQHNNNNNNNNNANNQRRSPMRSTERRRSRSPIATDRRNRARSPLGRINRERTPIGERRERRRSPIRRTGERSPIARRGENRERPNEQAERSRKRSRSKSPVRDRRQTNAVDEEKRTDRDNIVIKVSRRDRTNSPPRIVVYEPLPVLPPVHTNNKESTTASDATSNNNNNNNNSGNETEGTTTTHQHKEKPDKSSPEREKEKKHKNKRRSHRRSPSSSSYSSSSSSRSYSSASSASSASSEVEEFEVEW